MMTIADKFCFFFSVFFFSVFNADDAGAAPN